ncbi:MAG: hypothetical protein ABJC19_09775 [Gemmatimonadota bacterium]
MVQDDTSEGRLGEAHAALRQLSQLTGWVAHEVNNSLGGIQSSFALLQRLIPTDHPHYRYVGAIEREIARASGLTQRLQQSYGFNEAHVGSVPLGSAIGAALLALKPLAMARGVTITLRSPGPTDTDPEVSVVGQAAIRHALQHAIEGGANASEIQVEGREEAGMLSVAVAWSGPDPSVEKLPRSAPPGFALALSQQLVRALGGALRIAPADGPHGMIQVLLPSDPRGVTTHAT